MDTQPERFKDFGKRLEVFWDGDSVFYRGTVTAYSTTTGKHTILYDDNDVERVDLKVRHGLTCKGCNLKTSPPPSIIPTCPFCQFFNSMPSS